MAKTTRKTRKTITATFNLNGLSYRLELTQVGKQTRFEGQRWIDLAEEGLQGSWNSFKRCWDIQWGPQGITEKLKAQWVESGKATFSAL